MKTQKLYQMKGKAAKRRLLLWLLPLLALFLLTMAGCDKDDGPENEVMPVPEAKFDYNTDKIIVGGSVKFTDQSTNDPTFWFWDFKDGQTSTEQHPSHTYTIIGNYKVSLVAGNEYGTDRFVSPIKIKVIGQANNYYSIAYVLVDVDTEGWREDMESFNLEGSSTTRQPFDFTTSLDYATNCIS